MKHKDEGLGIKRRNGLSKANRSLLPGKLDYRNIGNSDLLRDYHVMIEQAKEKGWSVGKFLSDPRVMAISQVLKDRGL
jgi:hypothetical protein